MPSRSVKNVRVLSFLFDEANELEIARHQVSPERTDEVLDGPHVIVPNRRNRRGLIMVIGRDHGGACIAIPAEPTHDPTLWRPITAWSPCKQAEEAVSRRIERGR